MLFSFFTIRGCHEEELVSAGSLDKIANLIVDIASNDPNNYTVSIFTLLMSCFIECICHF